MHHLTFLGTSSGVPTKYRNVSALAVSLLKEQGTAGKNTPWILVDCGEATQHQLMHTPLRPSNLQAIFITHVHGDHCYGLPGLLASLAMHGRKTPLTIVAPQAIKLMLDTIISLTQMTLNYEIKFVAIESILDDGMQMTLGKDWRLDVQLTALSHRCDSYAFSLSQSFSKVKLNTDKLEKSNIPNRLWGRILHSNEPMVDLGEWGRVFGDDFRTVEHFCQKIVIAGDNDNPDLLQTAVQNADILVHESTYTEPIRQKILAKGEIDPKHSSALQIAKFAQKMQVPTLVLTHFSARFVLSEKADQDVPTMGDVKKEVQSVYDGRLILAKDFLSFYTK